MAFRTMLKEGDVIDAVCRHLEGRGYRIDQRLSTKETGIDVVASNGRNRILVEAKGATSTDEGSNRFGRRFSSSQQEDHVAKAMLAAARLYADRRDSDRLAIALPADAGHKRLVGELEPALRRLGIGVFLVGDDGGVEFRADWEP